MVRYVVTPWRDRQELLKVKQQFFATPPPPLPTDPFAAPSLAPSDTGAEQRAEQEEAVARVYMWMQRGNCPHMIESTAALFAAILGDDADAATSSPSSMFSTRGAYVAAITR